MKKFLFGSLLCAAMFIGGAARANDILETVAFYIPNRIMDALDMFSVEVGFGPAARIELMATEYVKGGGGIGATARAVKSYNRQYGFCVQNGYYFQILALGSEEMDRPDEWRTRWVERYRVTRHGIPTYQDNIFNMYEGARDFWRIGGALGLGIEAEVYLHPIDIADFVTGFVLIDLHGDDFNSENFM